MRRMCAGTGALTDLFKTRKLRTSSSISSFISADLTSACGALKTFQLKRGNPSRERSEEHTSELQSQSNLVCRLLLEKIKSKFQSFNILFLILQIFFCSFICIVERFGISF